MKKDIKNVKNVKCDSLSFIDLKIGMPYIVKYINSTGIAKNVVGFLGSISLNGYFTSGARITLCTDEDCIDAAITIKEKNIISIKEIEYKLNNSYDYDFILG